MIFSHRDNRSEAEKSQFSFQVAHGNRFRKWSLGAKKRVTGFSGFRPGAENWKFPEKSKGRKCLRSRDSIHLDWKLIFNLNIFSGHCDVIALYKTWETLFNLTSAILFFFFSYFVYIITITAALRVSESIRRKKKKN